MNIKYNQDIPGYSSYDECKKICSIINDYEYNSILEAGSFTGKLTWCLCKTFNDELITALDKWDGLSEIDRLGPNYHTSNKRDPRYLGKTNTLETFNSFNQHDNLITFKDDFLNYNIYHDIIILSIDGDEIIWSDIFDHAISLGPKLIIGRHGHPHRPYILNYLNLYEIEQYDPGLGICIIKNKKGI